MQYSIISVLASAGVAIAQSSAATTPVFCNAAALARGDCTVASSLTAKPTATSTPVICNAAALARGDCTVPASLTATSLSPSAACQAQFDACRGSGDPNEAACAASSAACFGAISTAAPAASSSFVFCNAAALARGDCTVPASLTATSLSPSASCQAQFDACRGSGDPNEAACAASSAACFGAISTASLSSTFVFCNAAALARGDCTVPASLTATQAPPAVVTEVVTALTTYCPAATTFAVNNKTYTVTSATTLTITNCPCTITKSNAGPAPTAAPPAPPAANTTPVICNAAALARGDCTVPASLTAKATNTPKAPTAGSPASPTNGTNGSNGPKPTIVAAGGAQMGFSAAAIVAAVVAFL